MASEKTIYVQKSELLNGVLRFSSLDQQLKALFPIDSYGTLRNRDKIDEFDKLVKNNGYSLVFENDLTEGMYN
jgi:hypothetical protein